MLFKLSRNSSDTLDTYEGNGGLSFVLSKWHKHGRYFCPITAAVKYGTSNGVLAEFLLDKIQEVHTSAIW